MRQPDDGNNRVDNGGQERSEQTPKQPAGPVEQGIHAGLTALETAVQFADRMLAEPRFAEVSKMRRAALRTYFEAEHQAADHKSSDTDDDKKGLHEVGPLIQEPGGVSDLAVSSRDMAGRLPYEPSDYFGRKILLSALETPEQYGRRMIDESGPALSPQRLRQILEGIRAEVIDEAPAPEVPFPPDQVQRPTSEPDRSTTRSVAGGSPTPVQSPAADYADRMLAEPRFAEVSEMRRAALRTYFEAEHQAAHPDQSHEQSLDQSRFRIQGR